MRNHQIAWLCSLAFALLVIALLAFGSADRRLARKAPLAACGVRPSGS